MDPQHHPAGDGRAAAAPADPPGAGSPDASLALDESGAPGAPGADRNGLSYPFEAPENGHAREVAPGVRWIRMALPLTLNHINLWALADGDGWTLVDTGMQTPETASAWRRLLAEDLAPGRPTRIVATHMHPDHVGMAGWLARKFEIPLWMTRLEYLTCRVLVADTGRPAPADGERFYRRAGWDEEGIEQYRARFGGFGKAVHALPDSYRRIRDGDTLRIGGHDWRVIVGTGHSPEHACLYSPDRKLLISGDQVLPKISSNVSVFPTEPEADPLGDWLASIDILRREVPDDVLVLPAHNEPFHGLHARLDRLAAGHARGLARLRERLAEPRRVVDVFGALFARPIVGTGLMGLATGEALAHLNYLLVRGQATRRTDDQGVDWYRAAQAG
jgi:glyoxylase-like metal-dependent hydrolase (beta-lactamase superfamily II)